MAGYSGPDLFTPGARIAIAQYTSGIPRRINTLCFNAMSIAYAMDAKKIDAKIVEEAATDFGSSRSFRFRKRLSSPTAVHSLALPSARFCRRNDMGIHGGSLCGQWQ